MRDYSLSQKRYGKSLLLGEATSNARIRKMGSLLSSKLGGLLRLCRHRYLPHHNRCLNLGAVRAIGELKIILINSYKLPVRNLVTMHRSNMFP